MTRQRRNTERQRREQLETLALLARVVVLTPSALVTQSGPIRRLFFVLSA